MVFLSACSYVSFSSSLSKDFFFFFINRENEGSQKKASSYCQVLDFKSGMMSKLWWKRLEGQIWFGTSIIHNMSQTMQFKTWFKCFPSWPRLDLRLEILNENLNQVKSRSWWKTHEYSLTFQSLSYILDSRFKFLTWLIYLLLFCSWIVAGHIKMV